MDVQIFGVKKDADTRKALRFFKERRIKIHFVDFKIFLVDNNSNSLNNQ